MTTQTTQTAPEIHERLEELYVERAAAAGAGLTGNAAYMTDLEDEIDATRQAYIGAAVTEIAKLRAMLDGPLLG